MRSVISAAGALALLGLVGCGSGQYPVSGKVTLDDGQLLTKGLVVFEQQTGEKPVSPRGEVQADGSFRLGTRRPGDGAPPGKYRVLISPIIDVDNPRDPPFEKRYTEFATSGLTFEVQAGNNEFPIRLDRPSKGKR